MVVFTETKIRAYSEEDLQQVLEIYKAVFAEPPWNENWADEEVLRDIEFASSQDSLIFLVAENGQGIAGFSWGYKLPFEKFPF